MSLSGHPGYVFKGKTYKTAQGLISALIRDSGADSCGMVSSAGIARVGTITTYANRMAKQVYEITAPKFGEKQVITRRP